MTPEELKAMQVGWLSPEWIMRYIVLFIIVGGMVYMGYQNYEMRKLQNQNIALQTHYTEQTAQQFQVISKVILDSVAQSEKRIKKYVYKQTTDNTIVESTNDIDSLVNLYRLHRPNLSH